MSLVWLLEAAFLVGAYNRPDPYLIDMYNFTPQKKEAAWATLLIQNIVCVTTG